MADKAVHITNGSVFTERLKTLHPNATILTWNEILCEGPCTSQVFSDQFISERTNYLSAFDTDIEKNYKKFVDQFSVCNATDFDSVTLWFEYDLFCHINLSAVVSYLQQQQINKPIFLVCSGVIKTKDGLFGLGELTAEELETEWKNKIELTTQDISILQKFWSIYTEDSHVSLTTLISEESQLQHLSHCIKAHLKRFPNTISGINTLETMTLAALSKNNFKSRRELVGYLLNHQGYYGFGDSQWLSIIDNLQAYFNDQGSLSLTEEGLALLNGEYNAYNALKSNTQFGGSSKYDYLYNTSLQKLETV